MKWNCKVTYAGKMESAGDHYHEPEWESVSVEHEVVVEINDSAELHVYITNCPESWGQDIGEKVWEDVQRKFGTSNEVYFAETQSGVFAYSDEYPHKGYHFGRDLIKAMVFDYLNDYTFEDEDDIEKYLY